MTAEPGEEVPDRLRLVGYLRVSTDEQAAHGSGLEVQRDTVAAWIRSRGHELVGWYTDEGVSGSLGMVDRPGLADAIGAVAGPPDRRTADGLVVSCLDRLSRDHISQEQLLRSIWDCGAQLFSCSPAEEAWCKPDDPDDPARALIRMVLGAVAQYERSKIRQRMRAGRRRRLEQTGWAGGPLPYGFGQRLSDGTLVPDPEESEVLARILERRREGAGSKRIAAELNAAGIPTRHGKAWEESTIRRLWARHGLT